MSLRDSDSFSEITFDTLKVTQFPVLVRYVTTMSLKDDKMDDELPEDQDKDSVHEDFDNLMSRDEEEHEKESDELTEYIMKYSTAMDQIEKLQKELAEKDGLINTLQLKTNYSAATQRDNQSMKVASNKGLIPTLNGISIDKVERLDATVLAIKAHQKGIKITPSSLRVLKRVDGDGLVARHSILTQLYPEYYRKNEITIPASSSKKAAPVASSRKPHSMATSHFAVKAVPKHELFPSSGRQAKKRKLNSPKGSTKTSDLSDHGSPEQVVKDQEKEDDEHSGEQEDGDIYE